jgi:hypothetical protein
LRYYSIVLGGSGGAPSGFPAIGGAGAAGATWTSLVGGQNDPGALNVEMDIITAGMATPVGGSSLKIWGVPLSQIAQAANLNKVEIDVYGGMSKGLPLANPAQAGLLAHGTCYPAFGNWIGTNQSIDIVIQAPFSGDTKQPETPQRPANIVHNWQQGQPLSAALQSTLATAFPGFTPKVSISSKLVLPFTDTGFYPTIEAFAGYIRQISQKIMGNTTYPGVQIFTQGKNVVATDGTQKTTAKQIAFQDLIGQPTWLGFNIVSVKTAMRADIGVGDTVTLPQTLATVSAQSAPQFRQGSGFQGSFFVRQVRHLGNFRQPDGNSWCTVFECASLNTGQG